MRLVLFLLLQISAISFAQKNINCPQAVSRPAIDFSMEMGPLRDQDGEGWCYAYGSADQLTHWMSKRGVGGVRSTGPDRVSPVALALDETANDRRTAYAKFNTESAGYIQQLNALDATINAVHPYITGNIESRNPEIQTACRNVQREPNGAIRTLRPIPGATNAMVLDTRADACDRLRNAACRADSRCAEMLRQSGSAITARLNLRAGAPRFKFPAGAVANEVLRRGINNGMCLEASVASDGFDPRLGVNIHQLLTVNAMTPNCPDCQRESSIRAVFPRFQGNIAAILDNFANVDPMSEFMKSCQRVQIPPSQKPRIVHLAASDFSRALEIPNPEPIGVTYDASIFDYSSDAVRNSYEAPAAGEDAKRPFHYSLLVGKRFNCSWGEEEFILRNSWGSGSCETDRAKYLSVPKNDPRVTALEQDSYACTVTCRPGIHYRACNERCVNQSVQARQTLHNPPFYCEDGLYIVRASTLVRASHSGSRLE